MADHGITVRLADFNEPADMQTYLDQLDAYARDPMGSSRPLPDDVRERLAADLPQHPTAMAFLAFSGAQAVGFATCFLGYSTFRARPLLNIHDIAVVYRWRHRGIAHALLNEIERRARSLGCCRISLEVRADNPRAIALYEHFGFAPGSCDMFMEKVLASTTQA
jgi:ribosomal protein S18 acetylase RimI-like enzyme